MLPPHMRCCLSNVHSASFLGSSNSLPPRPLRPFLTTNMSKDVVARKDVLFGGPNLTLWRHFKWKCEAGFYLGITQTIDFAHAPQIQPRKCAISSQNHVSTKIAISPKLQIRSILNFSTKLRPSFALRGWSVVSLRKFNMADSHHLENGHDVITKIVDCPM